MTTDSHSKGFEEDHNIRKVKKEDAKENDIQRQLSEEEYEREQAEIVVHLELLMEMLQRSDEDQKHGWTMRRRVKWQRLQEKRNQQVNLEIAEELRKIKQILSTQEEPQELREAEAEMEVSISRPEQGEMLGGEHNESPTKDLMAY